MERTWDAAVLFEAGAPLRIRRICRPDLRRGQVLIRLSATGVCRSQVMEVRGLRGKDRWLPHLLGHEGTGIVVEVGPGVTKVSPGDDVIMSWIAGEGIAAGGSVLETVDGMRINAGPITTFGGLSVVSEDRVFPRPTGLEESLAAVLGCAILTGAGMALNEADVAPGAVVLVTGLGGVGLAALLAARLRGARVLAVDPNPSRRATARRLGAFEVLDPGDLNWTDVARSIVHDGVDVAIDASGVSRVISEVLPLVNRHGTLVFASHPPEGDRLCLDPYLLIEGRRLKGSWGGGSRPDEDIPIIADLLRSEPLAQALFSDGDYKLEDINTAIADLEAGRTLRPILRFSDPDRGGAST